MSVIRDSIEAFAYIQRRQGWRTAFSQAAQFLRMPFFEFHRGYLLRKSLKEPIHVPAPEVALTIRQVGLDDLDLLKTIMPPLRMKRLAKKMEAGEAACVAMNDERVVAFVLAGFANTPSSRDTGLKLGPREAYLWAAYALPQCRRQGVVGAVNLSLCCWLQEKGYESAVLVVDGYNEASLGHCYKIGFRVTDRVTSLRILRHGMSWCTPVEEPALDGP